MVLILPNLYVGNEYDSDKFKGSQLHCAQYPWHRDMARYKNGYISEDDPNYLYIQLGNEMALNMLDTYSPDYFPEDMVNAGLDFIHKELDAGHRVLVHCNHGHSRGPSMAMLYIHKYIPSLLSDDFLTAEKQFKRAYPDYSPRHGIQMYLKKHWNKKG